jgi:hypothetical protein
MRPSGWTSSARRNVLEKAALCGLFLIPGLSSASDVCDRACLTGLVDKYMTALVAHDPGQLPLARVVRFTENGQELRLGDGLWGTTSAPGKYRLYVADPEDGQVGMYGTVFENDTPVLMALRLKIDYGLISEVETIVVRSPASPGGIFPPAGKTMEEKGTPRPQFLRDLPKAQQMPREELVKVANAYFTGLGGNTGRNTAPFAPTCLRWENGLQTNSNPNLRPNNSANHGFDVLALSCEDQQKSGFYPFVTSIRDRRFPVVDRERGLVMSFGFFDHNGRLKELHLSNGQTVPSPVKSPTTLEISELFQIDKGKIDQVEAVLQSVPYGMRSAVWDVP